MDEIFRYRLCPSSRQGKVTLMWGMGIGEWIGILALIVGVVGVYHAREQTKMMRAQSGTPQNPTPVSSRWLLSRHVVALAVLVLLAWMAAGFEYYDKHSQTAGQVPEFRLSPDNARLEVLGCFLPP